MNLEKYQLISFDLDDTLWDCLPVIINAEKALFEWLENNYPKITATEHLHSMREHRLKMMKEQPFYQYNFTQLRIDSLNFHGKLHGYSDEVGKQGFEIFITARNKIKLYPDAIIFLEKLKKQKLKMVSLTNGNADVKRIGIDHYFECSLRAEDVEKGKPHTDMFDAILKELKTPKEQCLHIGDDPASDGWAAFNAGIDFLWVNRKNLEWDKSLPKPVKEISSFDFL